MLNETDGLIWLTGRSRRLRSDGLHVGLTRQRRLAGILLEWIVRLTSRLVGRKRIVRLTRIRLLAWRRHRITWLYRILDRLTGILWLARILRLDRLTGILWLPRILWLDWLTRI